QRPGKPFLFGVQKDTGVLVFSFPGNPVSTFANYLVYFKDWLKCSLGLPNPKFYVILAEDITIKGNLTLLLRVKIRNIEGKIMAARIRENGSGDFASLALTDGFIILDPEKELYKAGEAVPFVASRKS
ncbi:MAG TPA: hypothetical protein VLZ54_08810, partial [Arenibacter sp.]|nr:hypothetical protein [Arenibacter sp.]